LLRKGESAVFAISHAQGARCFSPQGERLHYGTVRRKSSTTFKPRPSHSAHWSEKMKKVTQMELGAISASAQRDRTAQ
jgi:hypothetical protein